MRDKVTSDPLVAYQYSRRWKIAENSRITQARTITILVPMAVTLPIDALIAILLADDQNVPDPAQAPMGVTPWLWTPPPARPDPSAEPPAKRRRVDPHAVVGPELSNTWLLLVSDLRALVRTRYLVPADQISLRLTCRAEALIDPGVVHMPVRTHVSHPPVTLVELGTNVCRSFFERLTGMQLAGTWVDRKAAKKKQRALDDSYDGESDGDEYDSSIFFVRRDGDRKAVSNAGLSDISAVYTQDAPNNRATVTAVVDHARHAYTFLAADEGYESLFAWALATRPFKQKKKNLTPRFASSTIATISAAVARFVAAGATHAAARLLTASRASWATKRDAKHMARNVLFGALGAGNAKLYLAVLPLATRAKVARASFLGDSETDTVWHVVSRFVQLPKRAAAAMVRAAPELFNNSSLTRHLSTELVLKRRDDILAEWVTPASLGKSMVDPIAGWLDLCVHGCATGLALRAPGGGQNIGYDRYWATLAAADMAETLSARFDWERHILTDFPNAALDMARPHDLSSWNPLKALVLISPHEGPGADRHVRAVKRAHVNGELRSYYYTELFAHLAVSAIANGAKLVCTWLSVCAPDLLDAVHGEALEACVGSGRFGLLRAVLPQEKDSERIAAERAVIPYLVLATGELALVRWALAYWDTGNVAQPPSWGSPSTDEVPLRAFLEAFVDKFANALYLDTPERKVDFVRAQILSLCRIAANRGHTDTLLWIRAQRLPWPFDLCSTSDNMRTWVHEQKYLPCAHDDAHLFELAEQQDAHK
jgi:hypothetical protein